MAAQIQTSASIQLPRVATAAQLVLSALWIWSGLEKAGNFSEFRSTVLSQGILAASWLPLLFIVPIVEVLLGTGVAVFAGKRAGGWWVIGLSAATIIVFSVYVLTIPAPVLKVTGCGCSGSTKVVATDSHVGVLARNALLLALHVPALFRKYKRKLDVEFDTARDFELA
jgi:hypothetical protein